MGRFFILPYKMASEGGKALADALGGLRIRLLNSEYRYQEGDCIVNWGNGDSSIYLSLPELHDHPVMLNPNVNICINKKKFFERMQGHNIVPPFAFSRDEALRHLQFPIVCRTTVEGADGQGIVIAENSEQLVSASLYTQLMEKTAEYRVHLGRTFNGDIVLIAAQKKRVAAYGRQREGHDERIWTGENVFLDYLEPNELPRHIFDVTKRSMELMPELHFGGFDVIDTASWGARVVEVNSAPMLTPVVTEKYAKFIRQYVADRDEVFSAVVNVVMAAEEDPSESPDYQRGYADCNREMREALRRMFFQEEEE